MARAGMADASMDSDSIKGLAQSIAKPAYRRLLMAEPLLRRAVPALIIAFLLTLCAGAAVEVLALRQQALNTSVATLNTHATLAFERVEKALDPQKSRTRVQKILSEALPADATASGRRFFLTDRNGIVVATSPTDDFIGQRLTSLLDGRRQSIAGARSGLTEITTAKGRIFAATRTLKPPFGELIAIQPRDGALAEWRSLRNLSIGLSTTAGFVVLVLGFAFHWQSARAREADAIHETVHSRIDTALSRGRCGLWDWDFGRGRVFWSHSMFEMLGLKTTGSLLSLSEVSALVHPDDLQLHEIAEKIINAKINAIDHAFRMRHAKGHWVWLRARCELVRQYDSGLHLIGIAVDITEQQNLAEKTADADTRLRDAIETIPEAFVLWDADNRLVICNSKFQELYHLPSRFAVPGTPYETVLAASQRLAVRNRISTDDQPESDARSFEAQLDDGRWLQISERRTKDGGYVSVGTDITSIKTHEVRLTGGERRLRATVANLRVLQKRSEDLTKKYAQEKTRAEEANHAKTKFLANMSHELLTPLNAIIGFSEIMASGAFGPLGADKYNEYCTDIHKSGQYLLNIINDVLQMSNIEAGRTRLELTEIALEHVLEESLGAISSQAQQKYLLIKSRIQPGLIIQGDRRAAKQIVLNLLSNAMKFTPSGGSVNVRGRVTTKSIIFTIADSGIGITKDAIAKLGRPFEQVESQLTKSHQGSGLGLAIARSLIEMHGGRMNIRSILGKGTILVVRFPNVQKFTRERAA
jgi:two-component system cell cycle sensor histidine kinase PleC